MTENSRLVYSTDRGRIPAKPPLRKTAPPTPRRPADPPPDGFVRIRRETKGRGGKTVTTINGLPGNKGDMQALLTVLKQHCGAGGSRAGAVLTIQGDHRERVQAKLEQLGHRVKLAGG